MLYRANSTSSTLQSTSINQFVDVNTVNPQKLLFNSNPRNPSKPPQSTASTPINTCLLVAVDYVYSVVNFKVQLVVIPTIQFLYFKLYSKSEIER